MARRIEELNRFQVDFIRAYIDGTCLSQAKGPRGGGVNWRKFEDCRSSMYTDEDELVDMADAWWKNYVEKMTG